MPTGEVKELYVVIFSSTVLFHLEKQNTVGTEKLFIGRGGEGKSGATHMLCWIVFIIPWLEGSLFLCLILANQRINVVTDISTELLLTFIPLGFSI